MGCGVHIGRPAAERAPAADPRELFAIAGELRGGEQRAESRLGPVRDDSYGTGRRANRPARHAPEQPRREGSEPAVADDQDVDRVRHPDQHIGRLAGVQRPLGRQPGAEVPDPVMQSSLRAGADRHVDLGEVQRQLADVVQAPRRFDDAHHVQRRGQPKGELPRGAIREGCAQLRRAPHRCRRSNAASRARCERSRLHASVSCSSHHADLQSVPHRTVAWRRTDFDQMVHVALADDQAGLGRPFH